MADTKRRAHRIDVDSCGPCPFMRGSRHLRCEHNPDRPRHIGKLSASLVSKPPPDWCPLRGAVTMVTGPAEAFDHDVVKDP